MEDPIKSAFNKVKQDILNLQTQLEYIRQEVQELKRTPQTSTHNATDPTDRQQTDNTSTHISPSQTPYPSNTPISIGNEGVSTDRQTDRQTDNTPQKFAQTQEIDTLETSESSRENTQKTDVSTVLNSLNTLRSSLSKSFESLTDQEFLVFSTLYIQQEQGNTVTYQSIASKLSLTESSIRDYIQRMIKKGIPVDKKKINNKKIHLKISNDFKKLASLDAITEIREASKS